MELPGVGLGGLSTGVGLGGNPSQSSGDSGGYGLNRPVGGYSTAGIYGNVVGSGLQVIDDGPSTQLHSYNFPLMYYFILSGGHG